MFKLYSESKYTFDSVDDTSKQQGLVSLTGCTPRLSDSAGVNSGLIRIIAFHYRAHFSDRLKLSQNVTLRYCKRTIYKLYVLEF